MRKLGILLIIAMYSLSFIFPISLYAEEADNTVVETVDEIAEEEQIVTAKLDSTVFHK
ncbi:hypothetical protein [Virgibacillus sp. SK37]|uniref:hypothetical protein n=1 Tax=Virgibacillus sp. SK37 TaxID=403957 RepID=UPI001443CE14|nr:hypothetical protein [Virgibacillus sp. SK37]